MKLPRLFFFAALISALAGVVRADDPKTVELWPEGVPGLLADATPEKITKTSASNVHHPYLVAFPAAADKAVGTAAIICPGGSYRNLSIENEGALVAALAARCPPAENPTTPMRSGFTANSEARERTRRMARSTSRNGAG